MQSTKETLKQVFDSFDKDGDGFISESEIKQVAQELGQTLSANELQMIISHLDKNHDNKISFDEFYTWWYYGKENKMQGLVYFQMKAKKIMSKTYDSIKKLGPLLENKFEQGESVSLISVGSTQSEPKISTTFSLLGGQPRNGLVNRMGCGHNISDSAPGIIFKIKCDNSNQVKDQLQDIVTQLLEIVSGILPPEAADIISKVNIDYSNPAPNTVSVCIMVEHPLISQLLGEFNNIASMVITDDINYTLDFRMTLAEDLEDLISESNKETPLVSWILSNFGLSLEQRISTSALQKLRAVLQETLQDQIAKHSTSKKTRKLLNLVGLSLIQSFKIVLNLNDLKDLFGELPSQATAAQDKNVSHHIDGIKNNAPLDMLKELPFSEDIINLFKDHCEADFSLSVVVSKFAFNWDCKIPGIKQVVSQILN